MKRIIEINGMSCGHCEARVKKELKEVEGIESVEASAENRNAVMILSKEVDEAKIKEAVEEAGYEYIGVSE